MKTIKLCNNERDNRSTSGRRPPGVPSSSAPEPVAPGSLTPAALVPTRAQGESSMVPVAPPAPLALADDAALDAMFTGLGMEVAPDFIRLEEGQVVLGTFVRFGRVKFAEPDEMTGEDRYGGTVVLVEYTRREDGAVVPTGRKVEFNGAHDIDRALGTREAPIVTPGMFVGVKRGKDKRVQGRKNMVTEYKVATGPGQRVEAQ